MELFQNLSALVGLGGIAVIAYGYYKFPRLDPEKRYAGDAAQANYVAADIRLADKRAPYAITGGIMITIAFLAIVVLIKIAS